MDRIIVYMMDKMGRNCDGWMDIVSSCLEWMKWAGIMMDEWILLVAVYVYDEWIELLFIWWIDGMSRNYNEWTVWIIVYMMNGWNGQEWWIIELLFIWWMNGNGRN